MAINLLSDTDKIDKVSLNLKYQTQFKMLNEHEDNPYKDSEKKEEQKVVKKLTPQDLSIEKLEEVETLRESERNLEGPMFNASHLASRSSIPEFSNNHKILKPVVD